MRAIIGSIIFLIISSASAAAQDQSATFHQEVTWSPDGKRLSYSEMHMTMTDGKRTMDADVWIVNADGSERKKLTDLEGSQYFSSWVPDGSSVAFGSADMAKGVADIMIVKTDGSAPKKLTAGGGRNSQPAVSPDGRRIVFASTRDAEKYQLYVMDIDGGRTVRITRDDAVAHYNPQWSPDGKLIVFYAEKGDRKDQIWTVRSDGTDARLLTGGEGHNIFPAFCADGRIIFSSNFDGEPDGIFTMAADGSDRKQIGSVRSSWARISPDGKKIAWIEGKFPRTDVYVADLDGSNKVKLTGN